jgi:RAB protein geranylgeranyltransferase component A
MRARHSISYFIQTPILTPTTPTTHPTPAQGVATGVTAGGEAARAKLVVGDPSYFPQRCIKTGRVVRAIAILSHPLAGCGEAHSAQVIIPQKQVRVAVCCGCCFVVLITFCLGPMDPTNPAFAAGSAAHTF